MKITLSRYEGNINAPCSPKLIGFFQTLHAISPKFYRTFIQKFSGYHERTLRSFQETMAPQVLIINCSEASSKKKKRDKEWINQLKGKQVDKTILVSAMVDATKVPGRGEYSQKYHAWVGGTYPKHFITDKDFNQDEFVQSQLAIEIKVGMFTTQEYIEGMIPFKIIVARPQSTNEFSNEYNDAILHAVDSMPNVHCVSMAVDGLATETEFVRQYMIAFMNGTIDSVVMTDYNHVAKNLHS